LVHWPFECSPLSSNRVLWHSVAGGNQSKNYSLSQGLYNFMYTIFKTLSIIRFETIFLFSAIIFPLPFELSLLPTPGTRNSERCHSFAIDTEQPCCTFLQTNLSQFRYTDTYHKQLHIYVRVLFLIFLGRVRLGSIRNKNNWNNAN